MEEEKKYKGKRECLEIISVIFVWYPPPHFSDLNISNKKVCTNKYLFEAVRRDESNDTKIIVIE